MNGMALRRLARLAAALVLAGGVAMPTIAGAQGRSAATSGVPSYQHIFMIVMENHSYDQIIGNPSAPNLNHMATAYGLATNYYGVTHPSEPNYVATIGGDYFGIQDDAPFSSTANGVNHTIDGPSLASQLDDTSLSWKTYQQGLPYPGYYGTQYPTSGAALYASKHNPFLNFASVQKSPAELQKIVPDTAITPDLSSVATTPTFSYIAPDQCHDMHGTSACGDDTTLIKDGDAYVAHLVDQIQRAPVWSTGNTAIVITWDENDFSSSGVTGCCDANPGGGHVATIVITNHGPRGLQDGTSYNHYSLLQTIEDAFGLPCLRHTCDTANVPPMTALFALSSNGGGPGPTPTPELGSGELLATGLLPIAGILLYRRRRGATVRQ